MNGERVQVGRLAYRVEGRYWNAYYALPDTMEGAELIGSIMYAVVEANPEWKQAFMDLMQAIITEYIVDMTGRVPEWPRVERAPEHEKSGNA